MDRPHCLDARGYHIRYLSEADKEVSLETISEDNKETTKRFSIDEESTKRFGIHEETTKRFSIDEESTKRFSIDVGVLQQSSPGSHGPSVGACASLDCLALQSLSAVTADFSERFPLCCSENGCANASSALLRAKSELLHYPDDPYSGVRTILPRGPQLCVFSTKRPACCVSKDGTVLCFARWLISLAQLSPVADVAFGRYRSLSLAWLTLLRLVLLFFFYQTWNISPSCRRFAEVNPTFIQLQELLPWWGDELRCPQLQLNNTFGSMPVYIPEFKLAMTSGYAQGAAGRIYLSLLFEGLCNTYFNKWTVPITWALAVVSGGMATYQLFDGIDFCGTECWTVDHTPVDLADYELLRFSRTRTVEVRTEHRLSSLSTHTSEHAHLLPCALV